MLSCSKMPLHLRGRASRSNGHSQIGHVLMQCCMVEMHLSSICNIVSIFIQCFLTAHTLASFSFRKQWSMTRGWLHLVALCTLLSRHSRDRGTYDSEPCDPNDPQQNLSLFDSKLTVSNWSKRSFRPLL